MNAFDSKLLDGKTKLHFVGIGGSGMFPLVQILHEVGYEITGSDVNEGDIIDRERKLGTVSYTHLPHDDSPPRDLFGIFCIREAVRDGLSKNAAEFCPRSCV